MDIKREVESVLHRDLIGHEKAVVIMLNRQGMVNPVDIARELLTRHLNNERSNLERIQNSIAHLNNELAMLDASELPKEA